MDQADIKIAEVVCRDDLVLTPPIPLSREIISRGRVGIGPRREFHNHPDRPNRMDVLKRRPTTRAKSTPGEIVPLTPAQIRDRSNFPAISTEPWQSSHSKTASPKQRGAGVAG